MSRLLYLQDSNTVSADCTLLQLHPIPEGHAAILDVTPFYVKGGGQPSDTGTLTSPSGRMAVVQVIRTADGKVLHLGRMIAGQLAPNDRVLAVIDSDVRLRHARLHTAGEAICAAVHELGLRWPVTAASHVPGQSRVAFASHLRTEDVGAFAHQMTERFQAIVARDTPVLARMGVPLDEAQRLCPMDAIALAQKNEPLRLVSPVPGFNRPCMGAHLRCTGQIGRIAFRKFRLRDGDLSISYDLA